MYPFNGNMTEFDPRDAFDGPKDDYPADGTEPNMLPNYKEYDLDGNAEKHPTMIDICRVQNEARLNFKPPTDQTEKLYLDATARKAKQQTVAKEQRGDKEAVYSFQPELTGRSRQMMAKQTDHISRTQQWHEAANAKKEEARALQKKRDEEKLEVEVTGIPQVNKGNAQSKVRAGIEAMEQSAQGKQQRVAQKDPNYTSEIGGDETKASPKDLRRVHNERKKEVLGFLNNVAPDKFQIPVGKNFDPEFEKNKVIPIKTPK
jgi:hypothetical protein